MRIMVPGRYDSERRIGGAGKGVLRSAVSKIVHGSWFIARAVAPSLLYLQLCFLSNKLRKGFNKL